MIVDAAKRGLLRGHGKTFPEWVDTRDAEAQKGTLRLRSIDTNLTVGLNRKARKPRYEVWGPSVSAGGWVPLCICSDDEGVPMFPVVNWDLVCALLIRAQGPELSGDRAQKENDERLARLNQAGRDRTVAQLSYVRKAMLGELEGHGRHGAREMLDGLTMADEGRLKAPKRGLRHF